MWETQFLIKIEVQMRQGGPGNREQVGILGIKTLPVPVVFGNLAKLRSKRTQKQFPTTYYFLFSSILKSLLK